MPVKIKICGITRMNDALLACELGAYALGFVFAASPRKIEPEGALKIIDVLPGTVKTVGVFFKQSLHEILKISKMVPLDSLQIYDHSVVKALNGRAGIHIIPAFFVKNISSLNRINRRNFSRILVDREKGVKVNAKIVWEVAKKCNHNLEVILAGGLHTDNVQEAIRFVHPFAVDVASAIESKPGIKDPLKMSEFFKRVKEMSDHE
jgi:phosphoribosylanthranilate isomerase